MSRTITLELSARSHGSAAGSGGSGVGGGKPPTKLSPRTSPTRGRSIPLPKKIAPISEGQVWKEVATTAKEALHILDVDGEPPSTNKEQAPAWASWLSGKTSTLQVTASLKEFGIDRRTSSKRVGIDKMIGYLETLWRE